MPDLTLDTARKIVDAALAKVIEMKLKPMVITVLDARGCVKATLAQDGTSLMRGEVAQAMFGLTTQGLDLPEEMLGTLRSDSTSLIGAYVDSLAGVRARRMGEFRKQVIAPFRKR